MRGTKLSLARSKVKFSGVREREREGRGRIERQSQAKRHPRRNSNIGVALPSRLVLSPPRVAFPS